MNEYNKLIISLSEKYRENTAANLSRLVRIKSMSGKEAEVAAALKSMMEEEGFDEVFTDPLGNVVGRIGNGKKKVAFDGHIDTVDTGSLSNWSFDPFSGEIKDGYVYGRGSVDQKGGVASFVTAGRILKETGLGKDMTVHFVGSVMEEDCDGLCWKYIIEEDGIKPDVVVSTEPTNLNLYIGQRGRMEIAVEFFGLSAHGSAPERGDNAIYMASRAALKVEKLNESLPSDPFLGKGSVTISEIVSGSPSLCAVADYARIHLDRRLTWGETKKSALDEITALIRGMKAKACILSYKEKAYTGLEYGMEKYYPTWKMPEEHFYVNAGKEAFNRVFKKESRPGKWTFSTNGVVINGVYGIPVIGFGPGNEIFAHAPDEKVPVDDLVSASAFYAAFIATLSERK
ncbi:MAG: YgeY family selenium metabolism-linked hydrolase [Bacteroidales bacterium]|nr:YgeY family selenium metabolism-linked hydrolase [Bacteroidales bacterium]